MPLHKFHDWPALLFQCRAHLCQQLFFHDTANTAVIIRHTDILQIIQFAEDAHLAELADTCQEKETEIFATLFQWTEKVTHNATDFFLQFRRTVSVQHGRIIFINQHHDLLPCLLVCPADNTFDPSAKTIFFFSMSILVKVNTIIAKLRKRSGNPPVFHSLNFLSSYSLSFSSSLNKVR